MKYFLSLLFLLSIAAIQAQTKQYACTPCGYDCDKQSFSSPGKCTSCNMALVEKSTIHFSSITPEAVCERLKANPKAVLLDVRSSGEFNGTSEVTSFGHFRNAVNVNVTELETRFKELDKYKDLEVIVYCSHSHRSPAASYFLSTHGFKNVTNMSGGVSVINSSSLTGCLKSAYVAHQH